MHADYLSTMTPSLLILPLVQTLPAQILSSAFRRWIFPALEISQLREHSDSPSGTAIRQSSRGNCTRAFPRAAELEEPIAFSRAPTRILVASYHRSRARTSEKQKERKKERERERGRKREKEEERRRKRGRVREREREREKGRRKGTSEGSSLTCALSHAGPRARKHARRDRSRASFEKQCKRERHAGALVPSYVLALTNASFLTRAPALCPSFSFSFSFSLYLCAFPVPAPRALSFTPSLSTGHALVRIVFSFPPHQSLSLSLLSLDLSRRHVSSTSLLPLAHRRDTAILVRSSLISSSLRSLLPPSPSTSPTCPPSPSRSHKSSGLTVFLKCVPSLFIVFRSMRLRLLRFNLFILYD